ncbi:MAG: hypothetical protein QOD77_559 [Thermoplasmata archaeon]|jgi:hypothetical protein|nr:hypothetical protein [Thermoplasmata archaeon]
MLTTFVMATGFSALTGLLYAYVGWRLQARRVSEDAKVAHGMFVLWWYALAATSALTVATNVLHMTGRLEIWLYQAITQVALLVLLSGLLGLLYYLIYLYTGNKRYLASLVVLYIVMYGWVVALLYQIGPPTQLADNGWTITRLPKVDYNPAVALAFVVLLIGPQVAAALAYAGLYRKAQDNTQRYRIAMVAGSIVVWFGASLVASALQASTGAASSEAWQYVSRMLTVLGGLAILMAYRPPRAWQKRWGLRSIEAERPGGRDTVAGHH